MFKLKGYALAVLMMLPASAQAATLLSIDLSVADQITVTAEPGLANATVSGSDFVGIYIANFFGGAGTAFDQGGSSGNFTTANETADNSPRLYRGSSTDLGLNIYSFAVGPTGSFTAGSVAFTGSATWAVPSAVYNDMLSGPGTGSIFFPADTVDDIAGATAIGEYQVAGIAPVPLPASAWLLGSVCLGLGLFGRRRKPTAALVAQT